MRHLMAILMVFALAAATALAGDGPGGVGGCVLWLDAKDLERGPLAVWADKTGGGNDFRQEDPKAQPAVVANEKTGVKAVKFMGQQFMELAPEKAVGVGIGNAPEQPFHVFVRVMIFKAAGPVGGTVLTRPPKSFQLYLLHQALKVNLHENRNDIATVAYREPLLIEVASGGAGTSARVNGGERIALTCGQALARPGQPLWLAKSGTNTVWFNGLMFDLAVFDRELTPEEAAKVREQMAKDAAAADTKQ